MNCLLILPTQPAFFCEQYPVLNYTLEVIDHYFNILKLSVTPLVENFIHNLSESDAYSFKVLAANRVGVASTNSKQLCEFS